MIASATKFRPTSKSNCCPVCGDVKGKCRTIDSEPIVLCGNTQKGDEPSGWSYRKPATNPLWNVFAPDTGVPFDRDEYQRHQREQKPVEITPTMSLDERDLYYRDWLSKGSLNERDRADLARRGVTDLSIALSCEMGYAVPFKGLEGKYVGAQWRYADPGDGGRYRWQNLPGGKHYPGTDELPLAVCPATYPTMIALVEGTGVKPMIASELGMVAIGAAGGLHTASPIQMKAIIEAFPGLPIVIVPDAGDVINPTVMARHKRTAHQFPAAKFLWWEQVTKREKDIDDGVEDELESAKLLSWVEFEAIAYQASHRDASLLTPDEWHEALGAVRDRQKTDAERYNELFDDRPLSSWIGENAAQHYNTDLDSCNNVFLAAGWTLLTYLGALMPANLKTYKLPNRFRGREDISVNSIVFIAADRNGGKTTARGIISKSFGEMVLSPLQSEWAKEAIQAKKKGHQAEKGKQKGKEDSKDRESNVYDSGTPRVEIGDATIAALSKSIGVNEHYRKEYNAPSFGGIVTLDEGADFLNSNGMLEVKNKNPGFSFLNGVWSGTIAGRSRITTGESGNAINHTNLNFLLPLQTDKYKALVAHPAFASSGLNSRVICVPLRKIANSQLDEPSLTLDQVMAKLRAPKTRNFYPNQEIIRAIDNVRRRLADQDNEIGWSEEAIDLWLYFESYFIDKSVDSGSEGATMRQRAYEDNVAKCAAMQAVLDAVHAPGAGDCAPPEDEPSNEPITEHDGFTIGDRVKISLDRLNPESREARIQYGGIEHDGEEGEVIGFVEDRHCDLIGIQIRLDNGVEEEFGDIYVNHLDGGKRKPEPPKRAAEPTQPNDSGSLIEIEAHHVARALDMCKLSLLAQTYFWEKTAPDRERAIAASTFNPQQIAWAEIFNDPAQLQAWVRNKQESGLDTPRKVRDALNGSTRKLLRMAGINAQEAIKAVWE